MSACSTSVSARMRRRPRVLTIRRQGSPRYAGQLERMARVMKIREQRESGRHAPNTLDTGVHTDGRGVFRSRKLLPLTFLFVTTAATLAVASPASAEVFQFEEHDPPVTWTFDCGAVYTFTTDINGRFIFDGNDEFVRGVEQDTYTGTLTYQGRTFRATDHQTGSIWVSRDDVVKGGSMGKGCSRTCRAWATSSTLDTSCSARERARPWWLRARS